MQHLDILNKVSLITNIPKNQLFWVSVYGSPCYKTNNTNSDIDIICLTFEENIDKEYHIDNISIRLIDIDLYIDKLWNLEDMVILESYYSNIKLKEDVKIDFELDKEKLRRLVSSTSSNSWVKAKKKINQGDYNTGMKSAFHSLRIVMFGIQLAKYNKIIDWECCTTIWSELNEKQLTFEEIKKQYTKLRNNLLTEFRLLCPIEK